MFKMFNFAVQSQKPCVSSRHYFSHSAGGSLYCVANVSMDTYDCAVFYNRDTTISGTATRFSCMVGMAYYETDYLDERMFI